ncbi:hypothetical protein OIU78_029636 [Salix suchowensis]|nr:hypothetical protein OIU78_029636 [Salix suchowensis]
MLRLHPNRLSRLKQMLLQPSSLVLLECLIKSQTTKSR